MNLRAWKLPGNTVAFDYIMTILGAIWITYITNVPLVITTISLFIFGEILHYWFDIPTNTLKYLHIF